MHPSRRSVWFRILPASVLFFAPFVQAQASGPIAASRVPRIKAATPPLAAFPYDPVSPDADALEARWSWRANLSATGPFEARVGCGLDARGAGTAVRLTWNAGAKVPDVQIEREGASVPAKPALLASAAGDLTIQQVGTRLRVLWDNVRVAEATVPEATGLAFRTGLRGAATWDSNDVQPTEPVAFSDDFMRLDGNSPSNAVDWAPAGLWKTSGTLGPMSDPALNPNPFVYRAQPPATPTPDFSDVSHIGKWFWTDYAVTASVKPVLANPRVPLVAGLWAYYHVPSAGQANLDPAFDGDCLRAEVDFRTGIATIRRGGPGGAVLARSAAFDAEPGQWHKLRLEPGPGVARLYFDGYEVVEAPCPLAQGDAALYAKIEGENLVDFDDVHIGPAEEHSGWGEPALPARFTKDRLMKYWASNATAWRRDSSGTWWHSGDFFGAATLTFPLPDLAPHRGFEVVRGNGTNNSFGFTISRGDAGTLTWSLQCPALRTPLGGQAPYVPGTVLAVQCGHQMKVKLGDQVLAHSPAPGITDIGAAGQKLGIRPVLDGAPLPPTPPQHVDLQSGSQEQDGRTVIGVNITPVTSDVAEAVGLKNAGGAIVDSITDGMPAQKSGLHVGDVIIAVEGKPIADVDALREAVGAHKAGTTVNFTVLRQDTQANNLDWDSVGVTSSNVLDYAFTTAPVDWRAAKGIWQVSERWTCSPQWSFFAGTNDANPTLWSRFSTKGDFTLQAYIATPMDLARGERTPTDLCFTVDGDGRDLASGYSFLFSAKNHTVDQVRRGDDVVREIPCVLPPGAGDTHQDWFYVRLEARHTPSGLHFVYSVNGKQIADYTDPHPLPEGGHIAFWTVNGAISIARIRVWYGSLQNDPLKPPAATTTWPQLNNALGLWDTRMGLFHRPAAHVELVSNQPDPVVAISNPQSGGDWTTYITRKPYDARIHPTLHFEYRVPAGVHVNLYAQIDDRWREIGFTDPAPGSTAGDQSVLGAIAGVTADGKWHVADFDLLAALRQSGIPDTSVDALAFAAPDTDYLWAGLGGNHLGATFWIRNLTAPVPE